MSLFSTFTGAGGGGAITSTFHDGYQIWEIIRLNFNALISQFPSGTGSPEGVVTSPVSGMYFQTDGVDGTTTWVKVSGAGNTGWRALVTSTYGAFIRVASVTLADSQIKALPTTPVTVIAAPGAGIMIVPVETVLMFKSGATAYTNLSPDGYLTMSINGVQCSSYLASDSDISVVDEFRGFFGSTGGLMYQLQHPLLTNRGDANGWGPLASLFGSDANANKALTISISNAALGNLTGGNAGNKVLITTTYRLVTLPT